jgi:hypothetical protein
LEGNIGGGGIYIEDSPDASITYGDFYNNEGGNFTGIPPAYLGEIDTVNANGDSCDTYFNIFLDPVFVDSADFHLQVGSPCIDAGDPTSPLDPDSTIADIGAYYFHQNSAPPDTVRNLFIEIDSYDAVLTWDPVNQTIYGDSITVDHYMVFNTPALGGTFNLLAVAMDTTYTHFNVVQSSASMFYIVEAYVGELGGLDELLASGRILTREEVHAVLGRGNKRDSNTHLE